MTTLLGRKPTSRVIALGTALLLLASTAVAPLSAGAQAASPQEILHALISVPDFANTFDFVEDQPGADGSSHVVVLKTKDPSFEAHMSLGLWQTASAEDAALVVTTVGDTLRAEGWNIVDGKPEELGGRGSLSGDRMFDETHQGHVIIFQSLDKVAMVQIVAAPDKVFEATFTASFTVVLLETLEPGAVQGMDATKPSPTP